MTPNEMASSRANRLGLVYECPDANWMCPWAGHGEQRVGGESVAASLELQWHQDRTEGRGCVRCGKKGGCGVGSGMTR